MGYTTSYIMTKSELLFLINGITNLEPSLAGQYLLKNYLKGDIRSDDAAKGLIRKKLAYKEKKRIIVEPVVEFLARSILLSQRIWIVSCISVEEPIIICRTQKIFLYISSYTLIKDSYKITPIKDLHNLIALIRELKINDISVILHNGSEISIEAGDSYNWLKE